MSSIDSPAIEPGSLVLVTGGNGYIGSHVVDQLLAAGYRVRAAVRDAKKTAWMSELFDNKYGKGKFETVIVTDMTQEHALDEAVKGTSGVVHVATVLTMSPDAHTVIPPTIALASNVLKSAAKEKSVKRFVLTSSSWAMSLPKPNVAREMDRNTWNTESVEAAYSDSTPEARRPFIIYGASKTLAEQEAWKFVKEHKPGFVLNTMLPSLTMGEVLDTKHQGYPSTGAWCKMAFEGDAEAVRRYPAQYYVNVKDAARLHVAGLIDPEVQNERLLGYAGPYNWNAIFASLRRLYPDKTFPEEVPGEPQELSKVPTTREVDLLRKFGRQGWTSLDETIRDNTKELVAT